MGDEQTTLLKIEGDASGAKRAAQEAKTAVLDAAQTAEQVAGKQGAGKPGEGPGVPKPPDDAPKGWELLADKLGVTRKEAVALREAVGQLSPELSNVMSIGIRAGELINFGWSKMALTIIGISGALAVATAGVQAFVEYAEKATKSLDDLRAAQERMRVASRKGEAELVPGAAQAGLPPEAIGGVRGMAKKLTDEGIPRERAVAVSPYLVDEQGRPKVGDEEAYVIAASQQDLSGNTARERAATLRRAQRQIARHPEESRNAAAQFAAARERQLAEMAAGRAPTETEQYVAEQTGEEGDRLKERAGTVGRQLRGEPGAIPKTDWWSLAKFFASAALRGRPAPIATEGSNVPDPLVPALKAEAEQQARGVGRVRGSMGALAPMTAGAMGALAGPPAPTVINKTEHYHGIVFMGKEDTRGQTFPRIQE